MLDATDSTRVQVHDTRDREAVSELQQREGETETRAQTECRESGTRRRHPGKGYVAGVSPVAVQPARCPCPRCAAAMEWRGALPMVAWILCIALLPAAGRGAGSGLAGMDSGDFDLMTSSRAAQTLHLNPGERPRSASSIWGGGMIEETLEADVFVAGGGSAGTSAAIAAARSGARTVLVNGRPVLGGNSGSEVRLRMVGACGGRSGSGPENVMQLECREGGVVEEYQLDNAVNNPDLVPELFSLELLTLIKAEPKITLLQNTWLVGVSRTNDTDSDKPGTITSATVEVRALKQAGSFFRSVQSVTVLLSASQNQGTQRRYIVKSKMYIDATGDGRLGAEAGAEWIQGREGAAKYNESLAGLEHTEFPTDQPEGGPDHETEGTTIDYVRSSGVRISPCTD